MLYTIGIESVQALSSGSQDVKWFILPGQSPHWAFFEHVTGAAAAAKISGYIANPVVAIGTPDFISIYEDSAAVNMGCGGVATAELFVLTTASCVQGRKITHAVANVIVHPLFNKSSDSIYAFAVVHLNALFPSTVKPSVLDSFERANGTKLTRMELGGAKNVDYVQKLPSDQCDASVSLDRSTNSSLAGPDKQCVTEVTSGQAKPSKNAALFFNSDSCFKFVGFQLHPRDSNRFISVLDALNFIRGYAHNGPPHKTDTGGAASFEAILCRAPNCARRAKLLR